MPFEIKRIHITPTGFQILFTKALDRETGTAPESYKLGTFTHIYRGGYGGPEVDQTVPVVEAVSLAPDGLSATLTLDTLKRGHVYEFDLDALRTTGDEPLLHRNAYYTVNEIPDPDQED